MPPKKSKSPNDFKRLKSKLGKRAPQKLNSTSTEVKSSRLKLNSQLTSSSTSKSSKKQKTVESYTPTPSILTFPAPLSSLHQPYPLFLHLLTTHTSSSTRLTLSQTFLNSLTTSNFLEAGLKTEGFIDLTVKSLSLMLLDSSQNSKGEIISPKIASDILQLIIPHISSTLTIQNLQKFISTSLLHISRSVNSSGLEVLRSLIKHGICERDDDLRNAVFFKVKEGRGTDCFKFLMTEDKGELSTIEKFWGDRYGEEKGKSALKDDPEYDKVLLSRIVDTCCTEKGFKSYSAEKDRKVVDLLSCLEDKKKGYDIIKNLEWRGVKNWSRSMCFNVDMNFEVIGLQEKVVFDNISAFKGDLSDITKEPGFWSAVENVEGVEELWLKEGDSDNEIMLMKLLTRIIKGELHSEVNSWISVKDIYSDLELELILNNPLTSEETFIKVAEYCDRSWVRLGIKGIYKRFKPSSNIKFLSNLMEIDRKNGTENTGKLLGLFGEKKLNGVGGKVKNWGESGNEKKGGVCVGIVKGVGKVEGWEGLREMKGWEEIRVVCETEGSEM